MPVSAFAFPIQAESSACNLLVSILESLGVPRSGTRSVPGSAWSWHPRKKDIKRRTGRGFRKAFMASASLRVAVKSAGPEPGRISVFVPREWVAKVARVGSRGKLWDIPGAPEARACILPYRFTLYSCGEPGWNRQALGRIGGRFWRKKWHRGNRG